MRRRFGRKPQKRDDGFVETGISAETIPPDHATTLTLHKTRLILTRLDGDIIAFNRLCPHAAGDLGKGRVINGRVSCPDHGWKFDIRTGRTLWPSDEMCRLKHYPVDIVDGIVWVNLTA